MNDFTGFRCARRLACLSFAVVTLTACWAVADDQPGKRLLSASGQVHDLDLVPSNAAAFVRLLPQDLWKSSATADYRRLAEHVRPEALTLFEKSWGLNATHLRRVTLIAPTREVFHGSARGEDLSWVFVVHLKRACDGEQVVRSWIGESVRDSLEGGREYHLNEETRDGVCLLGDRTFVYGSEASLRWLAQQEAGEGPLTPALRRAAGASPVVAGFNGSLFRDQEAPLPFKPLAEMTSATVTLDEWRDHLRVSVSLEYPSADESASAQQAARAAVEMARAFFKSSAGEFQRQLAEAESFEGGALPLHGLAVLRYADAALAGLDIQRRGPRVETSLALDATSPTTAILLGFTITELIGRRAQATFEDIADQLE